MENLDVNMTGSNPVRPGKTVQERANESFLRRKQVRSDKVNAELNEMTKLKNWVKLNKDIDKGELIAQDNLINAVAQPKKWKNVVRRLKREESIDAQDYLINNLDKLFDDSIVELKANQLEKDIQTELENINVALDPKSTPEQQQQALTNLTVGETVEDAKKLKALITERAPNYALKVSGVSAKNTTNAMLYLTVKKENNFNLGSIHSHSAYLRDLAAAFVELGMELSQPQKDTILMLQHLLLSSKLNRVTLEVKKGAETVKPQKYVCLDSTRTSFASAPVNDSPNNRYIRYLTTRDGDWIATAPDFANSIKYSRVVPLNAPNSTVTGYTFLKKLKESMELTKKLQEVETLADYPTMQADYDRNSEKVNGIAYVRSGKPDNKKEAVIKKYVITPSDDAWSCIATPVNVDAILVDLQVDLDWLSTYDGLTMDKFCKSWNIDFAPDVAYLSVFADATIVKKSSQIAYLSYNETLLKLWCSFAKQYDRLLKGIYSTIDSIPTRIGDKRRLLKPYMKCVAAAIKVLPYYKKKFGAFLQSSLHPSIHNYDDAFTYFSNPSKPFLYYLAETISENRASVYSIEELMASVTAFDVLIDKGGLGPGIESAIDPIEMMEGFATVKQDKPASVVVDGRNLLDAMDSEIDISNENIQINELRVIEIQDELNALTAQRKIEKQSDEKYRLDGQIQALNMESARNVKNITELYSRKNILIRMMSQVRDAIEDSNEKTSQEKLFDLVTNFELLAIGNYSNLYTSYDKEKKTISERKTDSKRPDSNSNRTTSTKATASKVAKNINKMAKTLKTDLQPRTSARLKEKAQVK